jgi:hypothetical protein
MGANTHVCDDISIFLSYQVARTFSMLIANISLAFVHGVGTTNLKFTLRKTVQLKNMYHVQFINKILSVDLFYIEMLLSWFLSPINL